MNFNSFKKVINFLVGIREMNEVDKVYGFVEASFIDFGILRANIYSIFNVFYS